MSVQKIGVIGVGQMGNGIVQIAALAGYEVLACDQTPQHNEKASAGIKKAFSKLVEKGKMDAAAQAAAEGRIKWTANLSDFKDVDLIIEAITENVPAKEKLFKELDAICSPKTILATNTSSISITGLAAVTKRPHQVIGMHFFNPVPVMKLLEIIRAVQTDDATYQSAVAVGEKLGKSVVTAKDSAAFIVNRTCFLS